MRASHPCCKKEKEVRSINHTSLCSTHTVKIVCVCVCCVICSTLYAGIQRKNSFYFYTCRVPCRSAFFFILSRSFLYSRFLTFDFWIWFYSLGCTAILPHLSSFSHNTTYVRRVLSKNQNEKIKYKRFRFNTPSLICMYVCMYVCSSSTSSSEVRRRIRRSIVIRFDVNW